MQLEIMSDFKLNYFIRCSLFSADVHIIRIKYLLNVSTRSCWIIPVHCPLAQFPSPGSHHIVIWTFGDKSQILFHLSVRWSWIINLKFLAIWHIGQQSPKGCVCVCGSDFQTSRITFTINVNPTYLNLLCKCHLIMK